MTSSIDLSVRVGNRKITPAFPIVDASSPSSTDINTFTKSLLRYSDENIPIESQSELQKRERVLNELQKLTKQWVDFTCRNVLSLSDEVVQNTGDGGKIYTSGSYRLGVHEPGADIDAICVVPNVITKEHFFGNSTNASAGSSSNQLVLKRDPNSLAEMIRTHPSTTNFNAVEGAAVPILTFDFEAVNIDLLLGRLSMDRVPLDLDINNDEVLDGVEPSTEKSLNGPRVTNLIAALTSSTPERYQNFLMTVRCIRKWAKSRGLYSNKMGYWGGVNINIAVAMVLQLYPNASVGSLLRKFFLVYKSWRWPNPVMLCRPHDANLGLTVWSAHGMGNNRQVAPILTPAYPSMNSTVSVSRQTLQILTKEFVRGYEIVDQIWKDSHQMGGADYVVEDLTKSWSRLFEPSDFFIEYPYYLSLCITGPNSTALTSWAGFIESRLRKLVSDNLAKSLPLTKVQLWPKKFEACFASPDSGLSLAQRKHCLTYFLGFAVDQYRMRGNQLDIDRPLYSFKHDLTRVYQDAGGCDLVVRVYPVKELPKLCFSETYEGGKMEAMKKRRRKINEDPVYKKAKLEKKIAEQKASLVAKLEKLKEKSSEDAGKEEDVLGEGGKDDAVEEERGVQEVFSVNQEQNGEPGPEPEPELQNAAQEETDLLENALDNIQSSTDMNMTSKTRKEAELEREMLLAGKEINPDQVSSGIVEREVLNGTLSREEHNQQVLKEAGIDILSEDKVVTLGGPSFIPPWRQRVVGKDQKSVISGQIILKTNFPELVELDINGYVVDKGDENFQPSKKWSGRIAGFEFKLGDRGLGYYRTGVEVVIPSNVAY